MEQQETRPLTEQERTLLGPFQDPFVTPATGIVASLGLGVLIFVLGLGVLGFMPGDPSAGVPFVSGLAIASSLASYVMIQRRRRQALDSDQARLDLIDGTATVTSFTCTDAIAIEEFEDEGLTYYLRLTDGRMLLLSGQYLYEPVKAGTFPSTRSELVRSRSGILLGLTSSGERLSAASTRKARPNEFGPSGFPTDGAILTIPFEDLR